MARALTGPGTHVPPFGGQEILRSHAPATPATSEALRSRLKAGMTKREIFAPATNVIPGKRCATRDRRAADWYGIRVQTHGSSRIGHAIEQTPSQPI
ncbi:hypothetical protein [Roseibium sp. RKSG952]|uniref:hypothetical protein n=1 Tax=Roseibium sp. RKSG952 TaxID=2529384 RepID=UPI0012BD5C2B|nr:hypothetical protein [Roseibium sp. RKSG952]MTH96081.1 hypothetical protein [Roseibium sp. RKSG952]